MPALKIQPHPLFIAFAAFLALTGQAGLLVAYTTALLLHEIGHANIARRCGYALDTIKLMPYGAKVCGDIEGAAAADEIKIAAAGPAVNVVLIIVSVAVWWIVPASYSITGIFVEANMSVLLVNLLPVYPLDGGRIMLGVLQKCFPRARNYLIVRRTGIITTIALCLIASASIFYFKNITYIFMAIFVGMSVISSHPTETYHRLMEKTYRTKALQKGLTVSQTAVFADSKLCRLPKLVNAKNYNVFIVMDKDMREYGRFGESELDKMLAGSAPDCTVMDALKTLNDS